MAIFYVYLFILFICFLVSLFTYKHISEMRLFPWMLGLSVLMEMGAMLFQRVLFISPFPIYHLTVPLLIFLQGYFFLMIINEALIRRILLLILIVFAVSSLTFSSFFYQLSEFPGLPLNMGAIILIGCSSYVLFTLDPIHYIPIYKHPLAWICVGFIIFYSSIFFLNGIYNYLVQSKSESRILVHAILNNGSNCILYSCIIIGLICSHRLKRYAV